MSFSNFGGGLVNTIVAGAGNNIATGLANQFSSNIQFSVNNVLSGAVRDASGYALDAGQNYLLNQVNGLVPPSVGNGLANAVVTQVASVGINAAKSFASQSVSNLLSGRPIFEGAGSAFGLGSSGAGTSGGGAGGFIGLHAQGLPDADYGTNRFTTEEIVFSVVPSNAGPQTQTQPQTNPTLALDQVWAKGFSLPEAGFPEFKSALAVDGPGSPFSTKNLGAIYGNAGAKAAKQLTGINNISFTNIPVSW